MERVNPRGGHDGANIGDTQARVRQEGDGDAGAGHDEGRATVEFLQRHGHQHRQRGAYSVWRHGQQFRLRCGIPKFLGRKSESV